MKKWIAIYLLFGFFTGSHAQVAPARDALKTDSVTAAASLKYKDSSFFTRLFLGKNYRSVWATPVTMPVFHLRDQGFIIEELGGGQQTISLQLKDKAGHAWALRTIDKDVEKALPPKLRYTLAQRVVQDMISGAHPYAPLTIPTLAQATGVIAASPSFFFVPADPALKTYKDLFKNSICMLEDREPTPDHSETKNTEEFLKELLKNSDVQINEEAVLRARLLDMLIGDWDRHQDQWRWGFTKVDDVRYAYAIPRDRDQAFFYSNGLLVKLARALALKHLVGFAKNTRKVKQLSAKSWNFDHTFLSGLDAADWTRIIQQFTAALPDSLLHEAVKKMPPEVYPLYGPQIEAKLRNRRNSLQKDALRYQRFQASYVTIYGTDSKDRFVIASSKDSINIQQFAGRDSLKPVYNRTFHRKQTYQVTIVGLDGADTFIQTSNTASRIRLVIDGGKGKNQYTIKTGRKTKVYDSDMDANAYTAILKKELKIQN